MQIDEKFKDVMQIGTKIWFYVLGLKYEFGFKRIEIKTKTNQLEIKQKERIIGLKTYWPWIKIEVLTF